MSLEFKSEEERKEYYAKRIREMKRKKAQEQRIRRILFSRMGILTGGIFLVVIVVLICSCCFHGRSESKVVAKEEKEEIEGIEETENSLRMENPVPSLMDEIFEKQNRYCMKAEERNYAFNRETATTIAQTSDMQSNHAILVQLEDQSVVAERGGYDRINPASMTKILTVLVAAEHLSRKQLEDPITITIEDTDYSYSNDCSAVGFAKEEVVTVEDLLYGTILSSGGDAASALAKVVAGSREAFVDLMNEKLEELGLAKTSHFTNPVGLYDENHYSTIYDIAVILHAAVDNEECKKVLSAHTYTTSASKEHPEGITISNWFLRRIEDKDTNGEVLCAKTGYVLQSGNCAASYQLDQNGKEYICVTADAHSGWRCIYDHVTIYSKYTGQ